MKNIFRITLFTILPFALFGQPSLSQDCIHAFPICQNTYSFPMGFQGQGQNPNEINPSNSCLPNGEKNDMWMLIHVQVSGKLSFVISPNNTTSDYNWSLFNLTGNNCSDIFNGGLETACNASPDVTGPGNGNGRTGAFSNGPYYGDLGFVFSSFNGDITVSAGETYVLNISNHSGTTAGFSIDFSNSTAVLFNPATPSFSYIEPVTCGDGALIVHFNKPIRCNSVQPSDFVLGGYTVTNVSSLQCNQGFQSSPVYRLDLSTPIINSGNFTLNLVNAIADNCNNTNSSDAVSFSVAPIEASAGNDFIFCKNDDIDIIIGDTSVNYENSLSFQWTSSNPLVQAALSSTTVATPSLNMTNIPTDTVQMILSVTTGNCSDQDTIYLYFRDCCKNYNAEIASFQNIGCFGASTGQAIATATGSISGYVPGTFTYQWSNSHNAFLATGLSANINYTVTVTDPLGCVDTASITLSEPASPISVASTGDILNCYGDSTGVIDLTVGGATPPYQYLWSNGDTVQDPMNLIAGNYNVTITDANNCTITKNEQVTQPPTPINISGTGSTISCGATTGNINVTVSGGGTPYAYQWNHGATTQDINGVIAGTYTLTVTDAYGCHVPKDFTISTLTNLTAATTSIDAACASSPTGSATVQPTGGQGPYTYLWSNNQTTQTISNLLIGLYNVTITDATGCAILTSATIDVSTSLSIAGTTTDITCFGGNDGTIQTTISSNNLSTYNYSWSGTNQNTANISNLTAGTYAVTATDINGCSTSETFSLNQPTGLTASANALPTSCHGANDGSLGVLVNGGTSPYNYQWSNGLGISSNVSGVGIGTYTVTVTDSKGCLVTASATVSQPSAVNATLTPNVIACFGSATGTISVNPSGGTAPYSYTWTNGIGNTANPTNLLAGTYFVTVTDANGCTFSSNTTITELPSMSASATSSPVSCFGGNNGAITVSITNGTAPFSFTWTNGIGNIQNPNNLTANTYNVIITDANGCQTTTSAIVTEPLSALSATSSNASVDCHGDQTATLFANGSGGTPPYSYNWDNGIGAIQNPNGLGSGTYNVTVTDANGCTSSSTSTVSQPNLLTATATGFVLLCAGNSNGTVSVTPSGGSLPYSYQWSNNAGNVQSQSGLSTDTYTVTVTDHHGCTVVANTSVTEPSPLAVTLTPTNIPCNGSATGSISSTVTGGVLPYSYAWSNGVSPVPNPNNLGSGTYTVTITDGNGCTISNSTNITQPTGITLMAANIQPATCNQNNGLIVTIASGGTAPYTYQWSPNANVTGSSNTAAGLGAGVYSVTATDNNGCSDVISNITFNANPPFQLSTTITQPLCATNNGQIEINTNNSYSYSWSTNANTGNSNIATNLQAGTYTIVVSDANSCDTTISVTLNPPTLLNYTTSVIDASCGNTNGAITVNVTTGTTPLTYHWSITPDPGNTNTVNNLSEGNYQVTITDGNGCAQNVPIIVSGSDALNVEQDVNAPTCTNLGSISLTPLQGTAPFTYTWSANANTGNQSSATNLQDGTYDVTVSDASNCQQTFSFTLFTEGQFNIILDHLEDNYCPNDENGLIDITTNSQATLLNYAWSNGHTSEDITELRGGDYTVTVTDPATGCTDAQSYTIDEPDDFIVIPPMSTTISPGSSIELIATADDISVVFSWAGDDGHTSSGSTINVSPSQTTTFTLSASLPNCPPRIYEIIISVQSEGTVLIPEAFTPNGDGQNDEFYIYPKEGIDIISFQIFNRWGEMMHGQEGVSPWDGVHRDTVMPNDVYIYVVVYTNGEGEELVLKGQFMLLR